MPANRTEVEDLQKQAATIFTPGNPITDSRMFSGREDLLQFIKDELTMNPRKCLVLYGERGVGKTSFCNILFENRNILKHSCSNNDTFVTIFLNILSRTGDHFTDAEIKVLAEAGYKIGNDNILSIGGKLGAEEAAKPVADQRLDLNFVLRKFLKANPDIDVIFLDEFQNISQPDIQSEIVEVVKGIADDKDTKIITAIAGIAKLDKELLSSPNYDQYKGRHFVAAKLPRMNVQELRDIIDKRKNLFQVTFNDFQKKQIVYIATGLPHYVHKLALAAVFRWIVEMFAQVTMNFLSRFFSFFSQKLPKIENVDIQISDEQFDHAVKHMVREFQTNFPEEYAEFIRALEVNEQRVVIGMLGGLSNNMGEAKKIRDIAGGMDIGGDMLEQIVCRDLSKLVTIRDDGLCELTHTQLGPYIRSWECLSEQAP